jgi:SAM-dependent MidA family methyltransferase
MANLRSAWTNLSKYIYCNHARKLHNRAIIYANQSAKAASPHKLNLTAAELNKLKAAHSNAINTAKNHSNYSSTKQQQHSSPQFVEGQLVRDFLSCSLYSPTSGYFNTSNRIYSTETENLINFAQLKNHTAYYKRLSELYAMHEDSWLTPVEIFKPYYAQAIAKWMIDTAAKAQKSNEDKKTSKQLRIIEMGGGNGTCALNILDYLQANHPELYAQTHYTIVEFSSMMQKQQLKTLNKHAALAINPNKSQAAAASSSSGQKAAKVDIMNMSILDWNELIESEVFVIGLEVLDNMPHDKIIHMNNIPLQVHAYSSKYQSNNDLYQYSPSKSSSQRYKTHQMYYEQYSEITDPYINEYLGYLNSFDRSTARKVKYASWDLSWLPKVIKFRAYIASLFKSAPEEYDPVFIPTTQLQFLYVLKRFLPKAHVCLADFDSLPGAINGLNGPVVAGKSVATQGATVDYDTYLVQLGSADIFFPTDFAMLDYVYHSVTGNKGVVYSQYEFMTQYANYEATKTQRRFNPLLQDYANVQFFIS